MPRIATLQRRRALLQRARAYIARAYSNPDLGVGEVARAVGASTRQLQRVFRELGGEDFRTYLLRVRMEQAARLLTDSTNPLPIRAVARHVGYRQASGLRQAFVRYYGHAPSAAQPSAPEYLGDITFPSDHP